MATKKLSKKVSKKAIRKGKKPRPPGDSPIIIGGGGGSKIKRRKYVYIEFNHNDYTPNSGDLREHWNRNDELESLWINGRLQQIGQSTFVYIDCYRDQVGESQMRIRVKPLGVRFYPGEFPYDNVSQTHRDDYWIVEKVTANRVVRPLYERDPQQGTSDCVVRARNLMRRRSAGKRRPATKRSGAKRR